MREYDELTAEWQELLETLRCGEPDLNAVNHLIYDTYHFLKAEITGDTIPRNQLELYKYIGQVCQSLYTDYPLGLKHSQTMAFLALASGLCFAVESGFVGYGENTLRPVFVDEPAGFYEPEADITTYESFEKDYDKFVFWYQDEDDEDAGE